MTAAVRDLRGRPVSRLVFAPHSIVLVAGLPGAGKTTLLRRLYGLSGREDRPVRTHTGALVLDSEQARNRWGRWLSRLPYAWWRPLVHLTHFLRLWWAVSSGAPVVAHETGSRGWLVAALARRAARSGRPLHVVLLAVPATVARDGQYARGRVVRAASFDRHARRGRLLLHDPAAALPGAASVTLLDRDGAGLLDTIEWSTAGVEAARARLPVEALLPGG